MKNEYDWRIGVTSTDTVIREEFKHRDRVQIKTLLSTYARKISEIPDMTYVTGFWHVNNNSKRSYSKYLQIIRDTFTILENCNIVFFYNKSSVLKDVLPLIKTKNILFIKRPVENLKTYNISKNYISTCSKAGKHLLPYNGREKGINHYNRELLKSGVNAYQQLFTIWTSKLFILDEIMDLNPYRTSNFCWIDSGFAKFITREKTINLNGIFDGEKVPHKLNYIENNIMKMYGKTIPICACFFQTTGLFIKAFNKLYMEYLIKNIDDVYCHDEETILALIHNDYPELFNSLNNT